MSTQSKTFKSSKNVGILCSVNCITFNADMLCSEYLYRVENFLNAF